MKRLLIPALLVSGSWLPAQVPDSDLTQPPSTAPAPTAPATPRPLSVPENAFGGGGPTGPSGAPHFDPSSEVLQWNGKSWNVNDNRLFQARFEKYLNAPEATDESTTEYQALLKVIADKLAPATLTNQSVDEAFQLLSRAGNFDIDANLSSGIADAVYSAWRAMANEQRMTRANRSLEEERRRHEWNTKQAAKSVNRMSPPPNKQSVVQEEWRKNQQLIRDSIAGPHTTRLAEVLASIKANQLKSELSQLQTKIEFQALILQLFFQRRFQHVTIASRFYRAVFDDGDTSLKVGDDSKDLFQRTTGAPPTVTTLDALANEAMRDVREGVQAFLYLLERDELESATKRLAEAFAVGEFMPDIRTLPRDKKRQALEFSRKAYKLIAALEVKDYTLAEELVNDLHKTAKDFDSSKPMAAIETARTIAAMHISKARNAAVSGDRETLETELRAATEIWPRNPDLKTVSTKIFDSADVQQQALVDFERLLSQRNYRQIFDDRVRFIAATALYPDKQESLAKVLEEMQLIEGALIRSREVARYGDHAGAWENIERIFAQYPQDTQLNQLRADLTTQAAEFVRTLRTAEELEKKGQTGSSLAWYLKAQRLYPGTQFGREGIDRLVKEIFPQTPDDFAEAK